MSENIRMDSHKLLYHPERVADWLQGKPIYPIEMEVGLSGACNHRCIFCAVDYMGYQANFLDAKVLMDNLNELAHRGLKSIIFSGEGEPLLHKEAPNVFSKTKRLGIDVALATNGVLLTREKAEEFLPAMSWIRFSIAAATESTYAVIQRGKDGDLQRVFQNLQDAVRIKRDKSLSVTLGAQLLLLEENKHEVALLARTLRDIGMDYLTVKPFSQHPSSKVKRQVDYSESAEIEAEVKGLATESFAVYFRRQSIENIEQEKTYDCCHALPFMTHVSAKGDVFPCVAFVGNKDLCYGNLYKNTFTEIWESERAREIMGTFSGNFLKTHCRKACRLDEMNKYLHELRHPGAHMNFI